jgi:IPT/TIG domain/Abnormal spindle-like microcephaly-assoc'd, ASPM-SPD-2-Hydin
MVPTSCGFGKWVSLSVVGFLALLLLPTALRAQQTIHVPVDQPTIQFAINAANKGDTVLVAPGTYIENINFNSKAITVTSSGGPSVTIIDGGAKGSVVSFTMGETASSVLSGFTIRNGQSDSSTPGFGSGGGILIKGASPTIKSNVISGNHAIDGIGISINDGSPAIQNNTITGNTQCCGSGGGGGGGIHASASSVATSTSPLISGNIITNNSLNGGGFGGGILADYYSTPTIEGNLIAGNTAYNSGGGVTLRTYGPVILVQNAIVNNSSQGGGSGGGLYLQGTSYTIVANTMAGNTALDKTSGAFVWVSGPAFVFSDNIVVASAGQTAVTCYNANTTFVPTFSHNDVYSLSGQAWSGVCDSTSIPGNISFDPLFMSAANGDVHLKLGSPAIDAGDSAAPNLQATDFDGNPRTRSVNGATTVDMGAYEVVGTSAASINPNSLPFGSQAVGTTSSPQLTVLSSTGPTPFQISSVQTTSDFTQTNACPIIGTPGIAPGVPNGSSCGFNVSFTPATNAPSSGLLTVNGTNGTSLQGSLSGTGFTPAPAVSLSPAPLSFLPQFVGTTGAPQPVTLANTGTAGLNISSITASLPFTQTNNCPAVLAAAANCTINVTFQPTVSGNATGTLTIVDNASGSPHTVSLSGTGNPVPQPVAITLVQHASKDAGTTTSSSLAFPSNNTAGNWIAVAIRAGHSGQSFTVKDSNGNTYHQAVQFNVTTDAPNGDTLGVFYAENIGGGANQVTVSDTISSTMRIAILEYSGVANSSSLDAATAAQGSGNAPVSGSVTTFANGDLLLGVVLTGSGENFTAGSGYLIEEHVPTEPGTKLIVEDQVQPASGAASASVSLGASDNWGAAIAAFKSATTSLNTSPTITSLSPNSGAIGASVTITGTNFGGTQGTSTVTFNGILATPTSWSDTSIVIPVPSGATTGNVVVTVGGVASNGVNFTVTVTVISVSVVPQTMSLAAGWSTLFSANIQNDSQNKGVTWFLSGTGCSGAACGSLYSASGPTTTGYIAPSTIPNPPTVTLTATSVADPTKSGTATITVTQPVPSIASLSPTSGPVTASVAITGTNFGASQGTSTVTFNGTLAPSLSSWSATSIVVLVPPGATTGNVVVTVGGIGSNGVNFTVAPTIAIFNPSTGPPGTPVTITGMGFGTTQGTSTVTFNGLSATPTSWNNSIIVAPVPAGATTGSVVVTVSGFASNSGGTFLVTPNITSLNPTSGPVGTLVTIAGTNFGATQGISSVSFNGAATRPTTWSDTSITVPVPVGATTGNVVVTVCCSAASNGVPFTVNSAAPSIVLVQHTSKDAGTISSSSLVFSANNTAGNFIAVVIRAGKSGQVFSVSDSRGNVYKQAIHFNMTVDAETLSIFYAENIAGGANTITVSNTILGTMRFAILEYSGVATSNSLDVTVAAEGTGVSPSTGSVTTTSSGDLLLGEIVTGNPATFTAGTGYTIEERAPAEPNTKLIVEDQRQTIAGTTSAGASLATSDQWGAILAAFRHP